MSALSNADLEKIVEVTTREVLRGMNASVASSTPSSPTKIIEKATREILKGMNASGLLNVGSSSSSISNIHRPFYSSGPEVSEIESPSGMMSTPENAIEMFKWCLAICQLGGDCCIVGHIYHEGSWALYRTSYIRSIHENGRLLYDDDGNYFRLVGGLSPSTFDQFAQHESPPIQLKFLPETIAAFKNGIPPNYRMWVQRIAYDAQKQSSFSRNLAGNEANVGYQCKGRETKADKAMSIIDWERVNPATEDADNIENVDIDADDASSDHDSSSTSTTSSESEESEDVELPTEGESCENHVNRMLSGNPFKSFFYDKMLERTKSLVALKKDSKENASKRARKPRKASLNDSFSDGQENEWPVALSNEEKVADAAAMPIDDNASLASSFREPWSVLHRAPGASFDEASNLEPGEQCVEMRCDPVVKCKRLPAISGRKRSGRKRLRSPHTKRKQERKEAKKGGRKSSKTKKQAGGNATLPWHNVSFFGAPKATENSAFVLRTAAGFEVDVRELKRTRSGRLSRPPLDKWRGQRITTDRCGNITEVHHGIEDRAFSSPTERMVAKGKNAKYRTAVNPTKTVTASRRKAK